MSADQTASVINSWETVRYELLSTRICDLGLQVKGSPVETHVRQLYREFDMKGLAYRPGVYLTDSWGCPDEVPLIGIPFYLADRRLSRIEEEQTGEVEDAQAIMMYLRHEAGHAMNYAYRLWETQPWGEVFGRFSRPYRDTFDPNPFTRQNVRHLMHSQYRWMYAQKHPDEDFAETFAVWLTPRSGWRRKYRNWPAIRKLEYVARCMRRIRNKPPVSASGQPLKPVGEMTDQLAQHYGQRAERYRAAAQGYVDDKLKEVFPAVRRGECESAARLLRRHRAEILRRVTRWSGLDETDVLAILRKVEDRAAALALTYRSGESDTRLLDVTALLTALATDFGFTGRFSF